MADPFVRRLTTADKILLGAGVLYVIDGFLPWNRACASAAGVEFCASANLWHNVGILAALAAIALVVLVGGAAAGMAMPGGAAIVAGLAGGILVLTILKIIIDNEFLSFGAWIGLVLSVALAYGGYMKMQEAKAAPAAGYTPPPAPPPTA